MHLSLILAASLVGQLVEIAPVTSGSGVIVADTIEAWEAWPNRDRARVDPGKPILIGMLSPGTQLRVVSEAVRPLKTAGKVEDVAVYTAEVLDGPLTPGADHLQSPFRGPFACMILIRLIRSHYVALRLMILVLMYRC